MDAKIFIKSWFFMEYRKDICYNVSLVKNNMINNWRNYVRVKEYII